MADPLTPADLARLRSLMAEATPRPWESSSEGFAYGRAVLIPGGQGRIYFGKDADADLVVAAVNALPALLQEAERAARLERMRKAANALSANIKGLWNWDADVLLKRRVAAVDRAEAALADSTQGGEE